MDDLLNLLRNVLHIDKSFEEVGIIPLMLGLWQNHPNFGAHIHNKFFKAFHMMAINNIEKIRDLLSMDLVFLAPLINLTYNLMCLSEQNCLVC